MQYHRKYKIQKKSHKSPIRTNANSSAGFGSPHFIKLMAEFELSLCYSRCVYGKNVREFANFFFHIYFIFIEVVQYSLHIWKIYNTTTTTFIHIYVDIRGNGIQHYYIIRYIHTRWKFILENVLFLIGNYYQRLRSFSFTHFSYFLKASSE